MERAEKSWKELKRAGKSWKELKFTVRSWKELEENKDFWKVRRRSDSLLLVLIFDTVYLGIYRIAYCQTQSHH